MPDDSPAIPAAAPAARHTISLFQPLRHRRYRQLWSANLMSNMGTWIQTFASAWLIASLSHSASTTTLVQTASYLPVFLFALVAGVLADAVDRPKFLFATNLAMAVCACAMAALVIGGHATPGPILLLTFLLGAGSAFTWPAWQAAISSLVQPDEVETAATLNNLSYNVASIVGPALGGVLFGLIGAGALFLLNAASFVGMLVVYRAWWRDSAPRPTSGLDFMASFRAGLGAAFGSPRYRHILLNVGTIFFATIAFPALLPVYVRDALRLDSSVYGTLMGSLGGGAVLAAFLLPALRARFARRHLLAAAMFGYSLMLALLPFTSSRLLLVPLIVGGGMAWSTIVSTMNAAAQSAFPQAIRARTLSIYMVAMAAGYTAGSVVWGRLADQVGVTAALWAAGACLAVNAAFVATRAEK